MCVSAADIRAGRWNRLRLEVTGARADLYIDDGADPVLSVDDLRHGAESRGKTGLWVGPGTNGFFRGLTVTKTD
jgi:hypothetical protein